MVLLSAILLLTACQGTPQNSSESSGNSQVSEDSSYSLLACKLDIKYPKFLTDSILNSEGYKSILNDENAVAIADFQVVTSQEPVDAFFDKYNNDEDCTLNIYNFYKKRN